MHGASNEAGRFENGEGACEERKHGKNVKKMPDWHSREQYIDDEAPPGIHDKNGVPICRG